MSAQLESSGSETGPVASSTPKANAPPATTHGQILKSSLLIGGSNVFTILFGIARTKAFALILGPAGVGVFGVFMNICDLVRSVAVMGLNNSGVREIAEARSAGDAKLIARTVTTLRRIVIILGLLGAVLLAGLCVPLAQISFEGTEHVLGVAVLAAAVFFGTVSAGQIALLQGMRRIAELARANVVGALLGTVASIPVVYFLREGGIALSLVVMALATLAGSWWYSRQIKVEHTVMALGEVFTQARGLLHLGLVFMATSLMALGVSYLIRIIVLRKLGEAEAGYYYAAWVLGGLYVRFILQAMGSDFFPRLTEAAKDHPRCNRMVNEQAEISLLLAGPGILGTLTFAPLVIYFFYDASFEPAVKVLRWFCLGMMLQVASWPMGFILLAKGARRAFFWAELATNVASLGLLWICLVNFGLEGAGLAFFLQYVFYWGLIYLIVRSMSGFRWSAENKRIGLPYAVLLPLVFVAPYFFDATVVIIGGSIATLASGFLSLKKICALVPFERFPRTAQRALSWLGLRKSGNEEPRVEG